MLLKTSWQTEIRCAHCAVRTPPREKQKGNSDYLTALIQSKEERKNVLREHQHRDFSVLRDLRNNVTIIRIRMNFLERTKVDFVHEKSRYLADANGELLQEKFGKLFYRERILSSILRKRNYFVSCFVKLSHVRAQVSKSFSLSESPACGQACFNLPQTFLANHYHRFVDG